jgi:hypothetical protein
MGEFKRRGKSLTESLADKTVFSAVKTLNISLQNVCLHCFGTNNLISVQADAFRHSKYSVPYTFEESYTVNVMNGGVTQIA